MSEGVDYSTDHPSPASLQAAGKRFAARYVGPGTADKHLTADEAVALAAHGVAVVCVAEGYANGLLGGAPVGRMWADQAYRHALQCGMPANRPIYLAVDFDCTAAQWVQAVLPALYAAQQQIGTRNVGVYGSANVCKWAAAAGIPWRWQTYAWSGGVWAAEAQVQQYDNGVTIGGADVDLDRSTVDDFGQWTPGGAVPPGNGGGAQGMSHTDALNAALLATVGYDLDGYVQGAGSGELAAGNMTAQANRIIEALSGGQGDALTLAVKGLTDAVNGLAEKVTELAERPPIDPVAVAHTIIGAPEFARTLAAAVAGQLSTIAGSLTLSGEMRAAIAPPQA